MINRLDRNEGRLSYCAYVANTTVYEGRDLGEVLDLIAELRDSGMTMLMATHEMNFARDVADTVCFLHEGNVHESGSPAQILDSPMQARTREFLARTRRH